MEILKPTPENIGRAADALRAGDVVGMPTETVYGLAGNAFDEKALAAIFSKKERPEFDPLIVHVAPPRAGVNSLAWLVDLRLIDIHRIAPVALARADQLLTHFWPGPLTVVLPKHPQVPDLATSGLDTVAIRMPAHPVAQSLIRAAGFPLAAPSANRFGRISPTSVEHVDAELGDRVAFALDGGPCQVGLESTVVAIEGDGTVRLLRPGGIARERIEKLLDIALATPEPFKLAAQAPGMLESHYAPRKSLWVLPHPIAGLTQRDAEETRRACGSNRKLGVLALSGKRDELARDVERWLGTGFSVVEARALSATGDWEEAARRLFADLRALDGSSAEILLVEPCLEDHGLGHAIADRLRRASRGWIGRAFALALVLAAPVGPALAAEPSPAPSEAAPQMHEYTEDIERDFPLRSIGQLQITNLRGNISVQGWALDRIRVKAKRRATAASPETAKRLLSTIDFRYRKVDNDIELSAEYGQGFSIEEKLREKKSPHTSMDMVVLAPANLNLRVLTVDGKVTIKTWASPVDVRTSNGGIAIQSVRAETVSLFCPSCPIEAKNIQGSLRCMGGTGPILVERMSGPQLYLESTTGAQVIHDIKAEQLFVTESGNISGGNLRGKIEFHTVAGSVELDEGAGFLSGKTDTGNIQVTMKEWQFADKAVIESEGGNIQLALPIAFSGDVDVWSLFGRAQSSFLIVPNSYSRLYGPEPANRLQGRVGNGGEQLRIFSRRGNIRLIQTSG